MKKKNCNCEFIAQRDENLKREFFKRLGTTQTGRIREVFDQLAKAGAERFYISEERALLLVSNYRKNGCWPVGISANKLRMMEEIRRRTDALMQSDSRITLDRAVTEVVNGEAPSFYLTPKSIKTLFYKHLAMLG